MSNLHTYECIGLTTCGRKAQKKTERTYNYPEVSFVLDHENIDIVNLQKGIPVGPR